MLRKSPASASRAFNERADRESRIISITKSVAGKLNLNIKEKHWIRPSQEQSKVGVICRSLFSREYSGE